MFVTVCYSVLVHALSNFIIPYNSMFEAFFSLELRDERWGLDFGLFYCLILSVIPTSSTPPTAE